MSRTLLVRTACVTRPVLAETKPGGKDVRKTLESKCKRSVTQLGAICAAPVIRKKAKPTPQKVDQSDTESESDVNSAVKRQATVDDSSSVKPKASGDDNVLSFLKSRPQIAKMETAAVEKREDLAAKTPSKLVVDDPGDLPDPEIIKDSAWKQPNESVDAFLKRAPVADPETANLGPWLWVTNPTRSEHYIKHVDKEDLERFQAIGEDLLHSFKKRKSSVEAENPDRAPATITRKMGPYRDQLEEDLLEAALSTHTTCGKWMLFPSAADLPRYWRLVAEATFEGKLGPTSKVATYDHVATRDATLICVYTYNFADMADVRRVLDQILEIGLCTKDGRPIYYKCDAYTYLDIVSDNPYKLRASLFSSKDLFQNEARVLENGVIARLKKRNASIDSFLSS